MPSRARTHNVMVKLNDTELARLDEVRPPDVKRATFLRSLLQEPPSGDEVATRGEALGILTRLARDGRVTAAIALAKELRDDEAAPDQQLPSTGQVHFAYEVGVVVDRCPARCDRGAAL